MPPRFSARLSCVVTWCACISAVVPLSGNVWAQRLKGIADAWFLPITAWTATFEHADAKSNCSPSVWLTFGALVADPVCPSVAAPGELAGIKACFLVGCPIPMCHCMLALCHRWLLSFLGFALHIEAVWATGFILGASGYFGSPTLATHNTTPHFLCITSNCVLFRPVWVRVTPLCCHNRIIDSKGVVGTDSLPITKGATIARTSSEQGRPAVKRGLPAVGMTSWTSITVPPNLLVHARCNDDAAEVEVLGMVPLVLQQGVQAADVRALLLLLLLCCCASALLGTWSDVLTSFRSCIAILDKLCSKSGPITNNIAGAKSDFVYEHVLSALVCCLPSRHMHAHVKHIGSHDFTYCQVLREMLPAGT